MAELFKNVYNDRFFERFLSVAKTVKPQFDSDSFLNKIYDDEWESRELKQRMRHISIVLNDHLTGDYKENLGFILSMIKTLQSQGNREESLEYMFFPDFVELFGLEYYDLSVPAMAEITHFTSCEFAIRPFILKYEMEMLRQLTLWSCHDNLHIRRLASEGCRPRLPWAMALPSFKKDPGPLLPILENLKNDSSEYVRRSVANNLNDIAKDNPDTVIGIAKKWKGQNNEVDALVKHACRTLLKQGNQEVMELFGFGSVKNMRIDHFQVFTPEVRIGGSLAFAFELVSTSGKTAKIRLEYAVYYQKANGTLSKKVYKISERNYAAGSSTTIERKQSFKLITTRKFHTGLHQVAIVLNGKEFEKIDFELLA